MAHKPKLTGRVAPERIVSFDIPRPTRDVVERFLALPDATCTVSDVLDQMGLFGGTIGATELKPTIAGKTIVGPALTLRNEIQRGDPAADARDNVSRMGEFEAHNLASPGDVLVVEGVGGVSNMGGLSARTGKRQGEVGAIVMGGVRDIRYSRNLDYPIWALDYTPLTGKWRIETMEINGPVTLCGVRVYPGDLVVADDTGVCFVPQSAIEEVLSRAEQKARTEDSRSLLIDQGKPVHEFGPGAFG